MPQANRPSQTRPSQTRPTPPAPGPPLSTRLEDLSVAERRSLVVSTTISGTSPINAAFIPFQPGSTIRNVATLRATLSFGPAVPPDPEVREGVLRVAVWLRGATPAMVPGVMAMVAIDDQPLQPDPKQPPTRMLAGGLYRFTNYLHANADVVLAERLGDVPAPIPALGFQSKFFTVDDLARAQFAGRHAGMTCTWTNAQEIGVLDAAINRMGGAALRAGTVVIDRSGRRVGPLNESGHFDPNNRHIEIFESAFGGGATRIGDAEYSTFTICHEVAHAISNRQPALLAGFGAAATRDGASVTGGRVRGAITEYGNTSLEEYLAEAIAMRSAAPDVLNQLRPAVAAYLVAQLP
jgi:hypothetical protein